MTKKSENKPNALLADSNTHLEVVSPAVSAAIETHFEKKLKQYGPIFVVALFSFIFGQLVFAIYDLNSKISAIVGQSLYRDRLDEAERKILKQNNDAEHLQAIIKCLKDRRIDNKAVCDYGN